MLEDIFRRRKIAAVALTSFGITVSAATHSEKTMAADPQTIVDALKTAAGKPKARASFAKGQCVTGTYTPAAQAAEVTKSISFTKAAPILGRFSVGGGNPNVADTNKAVLRGFSVKFDPNGAGSTDMLFENAPIHFAKTLDQMLGFIQARFPGADGKPDPDKIKAFAAANPETTRQAAYVASKPLPGSFAGITYWGVHSFPAVNANGELNKIKFKLVPTSGEVTLSEDEAKAKPANFLVADLSDRLSKGPVTFDVLALFGLPSDQTTDITSRWPDEDARKAVKLGTIAVAALEKNESCDAEIFDPANLADGIGAPNDELFAARQPAYAISLTARAD